MISDLPMRNDDGVQQVEGTWEETQARSQESGSLLGFLLHYATAIVRKGAEWLRILHSEELPLRLKSVGERR
jgi:hypothetical protein